MTGQDVGSSTWKEGIQMPKVMSEAELRLDVPATASAAKSTALRHETGGLKAQGLYDPRNEHDACGVGFIVNLQGEQPHEIILKGLQTVINLAPRGAWGGD